MAFNVNYFTKPAVVVPIAAGMIGGAIGAELVNHDANKHGVDNTLFRTMEYSALGALTGVASGALALKVGAIFKDSIVDPSYAGMDSKTRMFMNMIKRSDK